MSDEDLLINPLAKGSRLHNDRGTSSQSRGNDALIANRQLFLAIRDCGGRKVAVNVVKR